jgi:hypothetical protein
MSYLSSYREQQHYEGTSSIPPFDVCVPTSPQPRVLSSYTLALESMLRHMRISSETVSSQIDALGSCPTPFLDPFTVFHPLSILGF